MKQKEKMEKGNFELECIKSLSKKHDVKVISATKTIEVNKSSNRKDDLGNSSHGKIDFLIKECNYKQIDKR